MSEGLNEWGEGYVVQEFKRNGHPWTETIWIIRQKKDGTELGREPHSTSVTHEYSTIEEALVCARKVWNYGRTAQIDHSTDARGDGSSHRYTEISHRAFTALMRMVDESTIA